MEMDLKKYEYYGMIFSYSDEFVKELRIKYAIDDIQLMEFSRNAAIYLSSRLEKIGFSTEDFIGSIENSGYDLVLTLKSKFSDVYVKSIGDSRLINDFPDGVMSSLMSVAEILSRYFAKGVIKANPMLNLDKFNFAMQFVPFDSEKFSYNISSGVPVGMLIKNNQDILFALCDSDALNYKKSDITLAGQIAKHINVGDNSLPVTVNFSNNTELTFSGSCDYKSRTVHVNEKGNIGSTCLNDELEKIPKLFWASYKSFSYNGKYVNFEWAFGKVQRFYIQKGLNIVNFDRQNNISECYGDIEFVTAVSNFISTVGSALFQNFLELNSQDFKGRELSALEILSILCLNSYGKCGLDIRNMEQLSHYVHHDYEIRIDSRYFLRHGTVFRIVDNDNFDEMYDVLSEMLESRRQNKVSDTSEKPNCKKTMSELLAKDVNKYLKMGSISETECRDVDSIPILFMSPRNNGHPDISFVVVTPDRSSLLARSVNGFHYLTYNSHSAEYIDNVSEKGDELARKYHCRFMAEYKG
jgi:hypothetical protein